MNSLAPDSVLKNRDSNAQGTGVEAALVADFEIVAREYRVFLTQIAVASTRSASDAEDVVQEALLRGYRGLKGFRGDCSLRIWLARIVVRVSINHHRSLVRRIKRWALFSDLERTDSEGRSKPFDAADRGEEIDHETMMDVERHLERLPERFRIPLLMLAVEGMTIPEIAAILEIPEGTVKSRIFYGRKRLKKSLRI